MWTAILPYAFQIIAFILGRVQANQATIEAFHNLIQASRNNGLISIEASDKFKSLHDQLMQQFKDPPKP